jgi:type III secretion system FlhB-like substrate exporter
MPTYEIGQFELHARKYRVEAKNEIDAVVKLLQGEAKPVEQSLEMIEVAHEYGLPADEHRELADALRDLGVVVGDEIPSIRRIEKI